MPNIEILKPDDAISREELTEALKKSVEGLSLKKVLLIPPDITRMHSYAGIITSIYYEILHETCHIDILPAVGSHYAMTEDECRSFLGENIPFSSLVHHNWRTDVVKIGEVPASFVKEVSEGLVDSAIDVEINKLLLDKSYDLILSIGQVVPHEVVGMANYSKNIFVGCGGNSMINSSHMLGAFYGLERLMGKDFSPVRKVFDYAEENFLGEIPLKYVLTVTTSEDNNTKLHGLFIGRERSLFESAVKLSQQKNLTYVDKPLKKVVVLLDEREFRSSWVGNKSIYRTRMAIADGGELIVLAPGVREFGEDHENDRLIRKFGFVGREKVLELAKTNDEIKANLSVAAHLIHASSDGRFKVTYAAKHLTKEEVEGVHFEYMPLAEAMEKYDFKNLKNGYNTVNGEEIYYIENPALGLWTTREKIEA